IVPSKKALLWAGPLRHLNKARAAAKLAKSKHAKPGVTVKKAFQEADAASNEPRTWTGLTNPMSASATTATPANTRANNPAIDVGPSSGQSESSIAALGDQVVVAWNDGDGFVTNGDTQGFAWSANGGATFTDGGDVVHASLATYPGFSWTSDPVLTVNEKTGEFWYCGLFDYNNGANNGIGVARGRFTAGVFAFDSVFVVRTAVSASEFLDKQWVAVDSLSGNLYVTNTTFNTIDLIDYYRSTNGGRTWTGAAKLSSALDDGFVQGSRVAIGPAGEVHVTWFAVDQVTDPDNFRYRKSTNFGVSFDSEVNAVKTIANNFAGGPAFNRERASTFPSIAVDRTTSSTRGRVYLGWHESYNFWDDFFPAPTAGAARSEVESNNSTITATPFTLGNVLRGTLAKTLNTLDTDYWSVSLTAGQNMYVYLDSLSAGRAWTLRLFAPTPDQTQRLVYTGRPDSTSGATTARFVFTAPTNGTYYMRLAQVSSRSVFYRVRTMVASSAGDRSRDQRDAFTTYSDNGSAWTTPVRVNDDPIGFDNFLPEVIVGGDGIPYMHWYDHRDDLYGSRAWIYTSRAGAFGGAWQAGTKLGTAQSNFSTSSSNIAPNHGDYNHFAASTSRVHASWSDGRGANVDTWSAAMTTTCGITSGPNDTTMVANSNADFGWTLRNDNELFSGLYSVSYTDTRGWLTGAPTPITLAAEQSFFQTRNIAVPDTAVSGVNTVCLTLTNSTGAVVKQDCFAITVQGGALAVGDQLTGFALAPSVPNPAFKQARLAFSLPVSGRVSLAIFDLSGARVRQLVDGELAAGQHSVVWDGTDARGQRVKSGAYFYRLESNGQTRTQRMVFMK
ncbi:MAG: FlgD immunoglobulin-like domain containing protein, partial [Candidatus Eisenbacteria bacterium]